MKYRYGKNGGIKRSILGLLAICLVMIPWSASQANTTSSTTLTQGSQWQWQSLSGQQLAGYGHKHKKKKKKRIAEINAKLNSLPKEYFRVEFFASKPVDGVCVEGEGKYPLGSRIVRTNKNGNTKFIFSFNTKKTYDRPQITPGFCISSTATLCENKTCGAKCAWKRGDKKLKCLNEQLLGTSEFSAPILMKKKQDPKVCYKETKKKCEHRKKALCKSYYGKKYRNCMRDVKKICEKKARKQCDYYKH